MKDDVSLNFKVGLFIIVSSVLFCVFLFTIGAQVSILKTTHIVETQFTNTAGLTNGGAVRLSGVKVGTVSSIEFHSELTRPMVMVMMEINEEGMKRIGPDTRASIRTEGLLGDKYIEIIRGTEPPFAKPPTPLVIESISYPEFDELLGQSEELINNIIGISEGLKEIVGAFKRGENVESVEQTLVSLRNTVKEIETGDGLMHTLIYGRDKEKEKQGEKNVLVQMEDTFDRLNQLLEDMQTEGGLLNSLLYDPDLKSDIKSSIANLDEALGEFSGVEGVASELKLTVQNLRRITAKIEQGEGTLGALINDPELYDNFKGLVGQAERSKFIRATVRYLVDEQISEEKSE